MTHAPEPSAFDLPSTVSPSAADHETQGAPEHVDEAPRAEGSWAAVAAIGVGVFALVTTELLPVGVLPQIARDMGVTEGQAGLVVTVSGLLAAIAAPLTIGAAGNIDRRKVLIALLGMLLISNLIVSIAPSFLVLLSGRVLLGATIGSFWTIAGSLGPRLRPGPQAGVAMAIILSGATLGTVAGVPAGALVGELLGWRLAFAASAVVATAVLLAVALVVPPLPAKAARGFADLKGALESPMVRFGMLGTLVSFAGQFAGYTYITPYLIQEVGISGPKVSAVLFGFGLAGLIGNILGGWAVGRSIHWALVGTLALLGASVGLLSFAASTPFAAISLILIWGLGFGMQPIVTQSWMFNIAPERIEAVQGVFVAAGQISIGCGALIGGLAFDNFGSSTALGLAAVTAFLTAAMFSAKRRRAI